MIQFPHHWGLGSKEKGTGVTRQATTSVCHTHPSFYGWERPHSKLIGRTGPWVHVWDGSVSSRTVTTRDWQSPGGWLLGDSIQPRVTQALRKPRPSPACSETSTPNPPTWRTGGDALVTRGLCPQKSPWVILQGSGGKDSQKELWSRKKENLGQRPRLSGKPAGLLGAGRGGEVTLNGDLTGPNCSLI